MIKKIVQFAAITLILTCALSINGIAHAQLNPLDDFQQSIEGSGDYSTGLQKFEGQVHGGSSTEPGADIITTVIFKIIDLAKYVLGTIAVIFMIIGGLRLITAGKQIDEVSEKEKENLKYIIYGLFLAILADFFVKQVFFGEYGECMASATNAQACAEKGTGQLHGIASFISYFIASIAVLVIVVAGFSMITSAGNEETIKKQKTRIGIAIVGLILTAVARFLTEVIFFPSAGTKPIDVGNANALISQITNFATAFITTLSLVFLIYGGYRYTASFGNEEETGKAKKILIGAMIGLLIAMAAFGLVRTVIGDVPKAIEEESTEK